MEGCVGRKDVRLTFGSEETLRLEVLDGSNLLISCESVARSASIFIDPELGMWPSKSTFESILERREGRKDVCLRVGREETLGVEVLDGLNLSTVSFKSWSKG